jgi:hypothetical protein
MREHAVAFHALDLQRQRSQQCFRSHQFHKERERENIERKKELLFA